ncbi:MAG: enoyl-CoA hydratase [Acidimicrobiaceae bacterium]|nr:enoyl-CoA hydratase [Acidimicrobiaceae bacterium]
MAIRTVTHDNGVLEITMDNPPVNALNIPDTFEISNICDSIRNRLEISVVIITATGKGFCAGVDIKELQGMDDHQGILEINEACYQAFRSIYECEVPVIAAVNGYCLGTGIGIAGCSDIVIASAGVEFGLPEVDNGALGALTHLERLVPRQRARQMLYTCENAIAEELYSYGTVYKVVESEKLVSTAYDLAERIANKPGLTIRAAKRSAIGIDTQDVVRSYRFEQGFTFQLNLAGEGDRARQEFLDGRRGD